MPEDDRSGPIAVTVALDVRSAPSERPALPPDRVTDRRTATGLRSVAAVALALVAATTGLLVWGIGRGFDFTDEGYAMLGYQPHQDRFTPLEGGFHILVAALIGNHATTVVDMRLARLVLTVLTSAMFSFGLFTWLRAWKGPALHSEFVVIAWALPLLGNFMSYTIGPQYLSYNQINNFLLLGVAGMALVVAARPGLNTAGRDRYWPVTIVSGYLAALDFFIKFPTAFSLLALLAFIVWRFSRPAHTALRDLGGIVTGALLAPITFFLVAQPFGTWRSDVLDDLRSLRNNTHGNGRLLHVYLTSFRGAADIVAALLPVILFAFVVVRRHSPLPISARHGGRAVIGAAIAVLLGALFVVRLHQPRLGVLYIATSLILLGVLATPLVAQGVAATRGIAIGWLPAVAVALYTVYAIRHLSLLEAGTVHATTAAAVQIALLLLGVAVLLAAGIVGPGRPVGRSPIEIGAVLLLLPLIGAAGTDNGILIDAVFHLAPWFGLAVVIAVLATDHAAPRQAAAVILAAFLVVMPIQFVDGYVWHPYRLPSDLTRQTVSLPGQPELRVDPATARFVAELRAIPGLARLSPATPIIALYDMPGEVYLLGGVSPGRAWVDSESAAWRGYCHLLTRSQVDRHSTLFLVDRDVPQSFLDCLHRAGFTYPAGYRYLGSATSPYDHRLVRAYAPQSPNAS